MPGVFVDGIEYSSSRYPLILGTNPLDTFISIILVVLEISEIQCVGTRNIVCICCSVIIWQSMNCLNFYIVMEMCVYGSKAEIMLIVDKRRMNILQKRNDTFLSDYCEIVEKNE